MKARVGTLNKTLKWKKERISKISIFENQKGKGYGNWKFFQKSKKEKRKGFFFAEIKKGKKERIFSENPERKGKMRTRAISNKTQRKTHTITIFLLFQNVGCTLMKSFWDKKLWQIKVKFMNYIPFQRIVVGLWLLRCSQQLELPLLIRLVAISFYSND